MSENITVGIGDQLTVYMWCVRGAGGTCSNIDDVAVMVEIET